MTEKLALHGGEPVRQKPFPPHPVIGEEEKRAVMAVLDSGKLSTFLAVPGEYFGGGKHIRELEQRFAEYHGVRHGVAFNSATAALHAAVAALGVEPESEVIVPPYTFTSTASSVLMHNAVPVFADIDDAVFGLDAAAVERAITPRTRAITVVHLFGHPAEIDPILDVARRQNLRVIEDCAQAPGARYRQKLVGTFGDCGIFSFTENKNITTGEGGMLITDDSDVAEIARLVRNHGEVVQPGQGARTYNSTILGWNYRMTEMEAALGIVQFGRMEELNAHRRALATRLSESLRGIDGLECPVTQPGSSHAFYIYAMKYSEEKLGVPRDVFVKALNAEGAPFGAGYVRPLYLTALYQNRNAYVYRHYEGSARYEKGLCPVAERMHGRELILTGVVRPPATVEDMDDIARAFTKVIANKSSLLQAAQALA
jgi:dTDP-4-amino-4,6-dideoxygalactose transaminase